MASTGINGARNRLVQDLITTVLKKQKYSRKSSIRKTDRKRIEEKKVDRPRKNANITAGNLNKIK